MNVPEGYFECPICHQVFEIDVELDRQATENYIREFGLEKFEEEKENLVRICINCVRLLKSYLN